MLIRFWGTRGSIASPGPSTNRYGGNTSCVEIVANNGARFICDSGTGARALGAHLMATAPKPIIATVLLSHTHWDHIQGFPFFAPLFIPGNEITVCGPKGANSSLPDVLAGQMEFTYFPVELAQLGAKIDYHDLTEGAHEFHGVRIKSQFLNHPALALGYRLEADGVSVCYLCDHEPYWESLWDSGAAPGRLESILHEGDRRHAAFMSGADVVIHDCQYTPEEYPAKKNWGHSTYTYVAGMAAAAGVKRLYLTHHDPTHDDAFLDQLEANARKVAASLGSPLKVSCAREGHEERFENRDAAHNAAVASAAPVITADQTTGASLRILIIDDDEDLRLLARKTLARAGHTVIEAPGGEEGLAAWETEQPDLVLLDLFMPPPDGFAVLARLRALREANPDAKRVPIVVLTGHDDESSARRSFELGATDFLSKPFTPPQLDARIRSCFARAGSA